MCKKIMEVRENLHCYFLIIRPIAHKLLVNLH